MPSSHDRRGFSRRSFLFGTALGLAAGVPLTWFAARRLPLLVPDSTPVSPEASTARSGRQPGELMPGRYPGRVIEVRHPYAVSSNNVIDPGAVGGMVDRGMAELTGYEPGDSTSAWKTLFNKDDVVAIKVNPVGRAPKRNEGGRVHNAVGSISSPALVVKIVACLRKAVGIPPENIIVFERYANEFCDAGYKDLVERELPRGVRWLCSAVSYSGRQLDIRGRDPDCVDVPPDVSRHVTGYDPDVFTAMGFCDPSHSPRDDRRFRSHLSLIVSRMCNKMINLPVLKDHRSAGVTLALKNMSHGMNNNVCRSHMGKTVHGFSDDKVLGPNQCNTFIPQAVSQYRLRQRATLHILDGLIGVYEGGPGCWNRTWGTWRHKGLFFATDPVALDHVCWDIIDAKRAEEGWAPVERMGWLYQNPYTPAMSASTPLAAGDPLAAVTLMAGAANIMEGRFSESFNVRQPDHVILAGRLGLGVFDHEQITYRVVRM
jgi:hypothetical protein